MKALTVALVLSLGISNVSYAQVDPAELLNKQEDAADKSVDRFYMSCRVSKPVVVNIGDKVCEISGVYLKLAAKLTRLDLLAD